ncbi:MAG: hypothetical protein WBD31_11985 [Rubripirellula sp.]
MPTRLARSYALFANNSGKRTRIEWSCGDAIGSAREEDGMVTAQADLRHGQRSVNDSAGLLAA